MMSFLLLPLYTDILATSGFGAVTVIFSWFAISNVVLAYGMETAFFRFYQQATEQLKVLSTSLMSILISTGLFVLIAINFKQELASMIQVNTTIIKLAIGILALDALAIIPFARLRAEEKAGKYTVIKISNVAINLGLNLVFLLLFPFLHEMDESLLLGFYREDFVIEYIFISNLIASGVTLLLVIKNYLSIPWKLDYALLKKMLAYGLPVMIAGIAFTINEVFDKILLSRLLPADIANSEAGKYAACYKLALFMTLFATAYRLGIEPFFFSHLKNKNPQKAYAHILYYFVIFGSVILLSVVVFLDYIKQLAILDSSYWEAMPVVPIVLLASFCLGIYHNLSVWYKVIDKTHIGAYISVFGALITIVVNFAFIPSYGYYASAFATLGAYGSMMMISFILGRKHYYIPYDLKRIGGYFFSSILLAAVVFYGFSNDLKIGLPILSLFVVLLYIFERKTLKKHFTKA
jgi:O-antigen/teichoic acid export membrane protein